MKNGQFSLLKDKHGFVIGGMEDMSYKEYEITLEPGDKLFVYTDGVPESTNTANEMFGTDRMIDVLNEDPQAAPEQILQRMSKALDDFVLEAEQFDDITMMCIAYNGTKRMDDKSV
jgi:sigma-B regulation protein RsbU (phosphoserine phosphatase)